MKLKKNTDKYIIIGIIFVVILCIINYNMNKSKDKEINYNEMTEDEIVAAIDNKINDIEVTELSEEDESSRMKSYVSKFTKALENKEYEEAYGMLYDDFKKNYFPTLAEFDAYCRKTFPSMMTLEYTNIERNGDVYVLWINMGSSLGSKDDVKEINFIVKENALNDFVLSFSVI